MLISAHWSKWSPLPDFTGSLWQRQLFTSQLSLGFWTCLLLTSLDRWGLLLGSVFGWGSYLSFEVGWPQGVPRAENSCLGSLDSLVRLTTWSGLGTLLSSRWGWELASLPGGTMRWDPNQARMHLFCSANRKSHSLCFLFQCHYKQGCLMGYTVSCVLW